MCFLFGKAFLSVVKVVLKIDCVLWVKEIGHLDSDPGPAINRNFALMVDRVALDHFSLSISLFILNIS